MKISSISNTSTFETSNLDILGGEQVYIFSTRLESLEHPVICHVTVVTHYLSEEGEGKGKQHFLVPKKKQGL